MAKRLSLDIVEIKFGDLNAQHHRCACIKFKVSILNLVTFEKFTKFPILPKVSCYTVINKFKCTYYVCTISFQEVIVFLSSAHDQTNPQTEIGFCADYENLVGFIQAHSVAMVLLTVTS